MLKPKWSFGLVSLLCADAVAVASEHRATASSEQMNRFLRMGFPLREVKLSIECLGADYKARRRDVAMASTAGRGGWLRRRVEMIPSLSKPQSWVEQKNHGDHLGHGEKGEKAL